jgi:nucleoid-associated protein YgaU
VQSSESLKRLEKEIDVKRGKGVSFMTSEAKIGLLLGLVVIVIIALVVNGLPSFHKEHSTNDLTRDMVRLDNSPPVLAENERQVSRDVLTPNINLQPASQQSGLQPPNQQNIGTDVRSVIPVPGQTGIVNQTAGSSNLTTQPAGGNLIATGQQTTAVSTAVPNQTTAGSGNVLIGGQQPALSQNPVVRNEQTTRPAAAQSKTYVVQSGDSLASIAVKSYGAKEGNRKVNIDRIFNANKNVLKSPDEIYEGQKLVIPSLPGSTTETASSSTSTAGRITAGSSNAAVRSGADKEYVVAEGDSLWKIADAKLGNGTRYTEILKLNSDVLKNNEDSLSVGMKLRLPAK